MGDFGKFKRLTGVKKNFSSDGAFSQNSSFKLIQEEAEKNWDSLAKQVSELGERLTEAAQAAWEKLTAPRSEEAAILILKV